ncbi:hypothetical protein ACWCXX_39460 [Streptomyces sp. NPDC001732]
MTHDHLTAPALVALTARAEYHSDWHVYIDDPVDGPLGYCTGTGPDEPFDPAAATRALEHGGEPCRFPAVTPYRRPGPALRLAGAALAAGHGGFPGLVQCDPGQVHSAGAECFGHDHTCLTGRPTRMASWAIGGIG